MKNSLRILSLGAGVQSSTLALMINKGEVSMVDAAIFADTGGEPIHQSEQGNMQPVEHTTQNT